MKKTFLILLCLVFAICVNAQIAEPISNGCGSESSKLSQVGAKVVKPIDAVVTRTTNKQQKESCDQHDKDYYNGVDRTKADNDFQKRSPVMGTVVKSVPSIASKSHAEAQEDKKTSEKLQPDWERKNQQSLDSKNYKIVNK